MTDALVAPAALNVPPSEMAWRRPPDGHLTVWLADTKCRAATLDEHETRLCRRPNCGRHPVMAMHRANGWWLYCAEHLYGRRIRNGVVEHRHFERVPT